jgi:hypothetical protein
MLARTPTIRRNSWRWEWRSACTVSQTVLIGAFSSTFHAGGELVVGIGRLVALSVAVYLVLRRALGPRLGSQINE